MAGVHNNDTQPVTQHLQDDTLSSISDPSEPPLLRASPEPMDPDSHSGYGDTSFCDRDNNTIARHRHSEPGLLPSVRIRQNSAPIHHHIAPALAAPFMKAQGLVHRGIVPESAVCLDVFWHPPIWGFVRMTVLEFDSVSNTCRVGVCFKQRWRIWLILGHLVHRYEDGTESPVPVQLKSLGDGSVITRIAPSISLKLRVIGD